MANKKRRKLYGAAAAAHAKKVGRRKVRRSRKAAPAPAPARKRRVRRTYRKASRRRHTVHAYKARHHKRTWTSHARRKAWKVRQHMSNPWGRPGQAAIEGLVAAGIILGGLFVVGFANRQLQRVPALSAGYMNLAGKLGIALAGAMGAAYAVKQGWLSKGNGVALMGVSFVPVAVGALNQFVPAVAQQISLAGVGERGLESVVTEGAVGAELQAELQAEMEQEVGAELQAEMEAEESGSY